MELTGGNERERSSIVGELETHYVKQLILPIMYISMGALIWTAV